MLLTELILPNELIKKLVNVRVENMLLEQQIKLKDGIDWVIDFEMRGHNIYFPVVRFFKNKSILMLNIEFGGHCFLAREYDHGLEAYQKDPIIWYSSDVERVSEFLGVKNE